MTIRELKFEGIDDWYRPVFKDKDNNRYGNTDILFNWGTPFEEVIKKISENDICYFGTTFGCEPEGWKVRPEKIKLVKTFSE